MWHDDGRVETKMWHDDGRVEEERRGEERRGEEGRGEEIRRTIYSPTSEGLL
jgi:hypothetical protein